MCSNLIHNYVILNRITEKSKTLLRDQYPDKVTITHKRKNKTKKIPIKMPLKKTILL